MPRQCILTAAERSALLAFPIKKSELIRLYTFSEQDFSAIKQRRGDSNLFGFAVFLCALRYPGQAQPPRTRDQLAGKPVPHPHSNTAPSALLSV